MNFLSNIFMLLMIVSASFGELLWPLIPLKSIAKDLDEVRLCEKKFPREDPLEYTTITFPSNKISFKHIPDEDEPCAAVLVHGTVTLIDLERTQDDDNQITKGREILLLYRNGQFEYATVDGSEASIDFEDLRNISFEPLDSFAFVIAIINHRTIPPQSNVLHIVYSTADLFREAVRKDSLDLLETRSRLKEEDTINFVSEGTVDVLNVGATQKKTTFKVSYSFKDVKKGGLPRVILPNDIKAILPMIDLRLKRETQMYGEFVKYSDLQLDQTTGKFIDLDGHKFEIEAFRVYPYCFSESTQRDEYISKVPTSITMEIKSDVTSVMPTVPNHVGLVEHVGNIRYYARYEEKRFFGVSKEERRKLVVEGTFFGYFDSETPKDENILIRRDVGYDTILVPQNDDSSSKPDQKEIARIQREHPAIRLSAFSDHGPNLIIQKRITYVERRDVQWFWEKLNPEQICKKGRFTQMLLVYYKGLKFRVHCSYLNVVTFLDTSSEKDGFGALLEKGQSSLSRLHSFEEEVQYVRNTNTFNDIKNDGEEAEIYAFRVFSDIYKDQSMEIEQEDLRRDIDRLCEITLEKVENRRTDRKTVGAFRVGDKDLFQCVPRNRNIVKKNPEVKLIGRQPGNVKDKEMTPVSREGGSLTRKLTFPSKTWKLKEMDPDAKVYVYYETLKRLKSIAKALITKLREYCETGFKNSAPMHVGIELVKDHYIASKFRCGKNTLTVDFTAETGKKVKAVADDGGEAATPEGEAATLGAEAATPGGEASQLGREAATPGEADTPRPADRKVQLIAEDGSVHFFKPPKITFSELCSYVEFESNEWADIYAFKVISSDETEDMKQLVSTIRKNEANVLTFCDNTNSRQEIKFHLYDPEEDSIF